MKIGFSKIVLAAAMIGLLGSCAEMMGSKDPISQRRDAMKSYGGNMKAIGAFVKSGKGSASDVAARARRMAASAGRMKDLFPKGTSLKDMPGKTRAKPEIWTKMAAFDQAANIFAVYATRVADAAGSGDRKAIGAAMGQLGKRGCGGCHSDFRGPKPK